MKHSFSEWESLIPLKIFSAKEVFNDWKEERSKIEDFDSRIDRQPKVEDEILEDDTAVVRLH